MTSASPPVGRCGTSILAVAALLILSAAAAPSCHAFVARPSGRRAATARLHAFAPSTGDGENAVSSVTVRRTLPDATPIEAREVWMEHHWRKGGGLPLAILAPSSPDDGDEKRSRKRTILPVFTKETVQCDEESEDATSVGLSYTVTESGPFFADLIPGSHNATVTFDAAACEDGNERNGCVMTWEVSFATARWASLYEAVARWTVGTAATTVQEAAATPRLFSATTNIDGSKCALDPEAARRECLDFLFAGGGLPLPSPIPYGDVLPEGGGAARRNLLRVPPLITESILDATAAGGTAEFRYRLNDPGWLTFPFLMHTHLGRVRFSSAASSDLVIDWDVEIRPFKVASPVVEKLVEMTVATLLRNLRVRLLEPDAVVVVKPPRGNAEWLGGRTSLGEVAKDSWLGGVLDAHLSDTRSTLDQTLSLLQPWTWGRSGNGDVDDAVQFQWTDGRKITT